MTDRSPAPTLAEDEKDFINKITSQRVLRVQGGRGLAQLAANLHEQIAEEAARAVCAEGDRYHSEYTHKIVDPRTTTMDQLREAMARDMALRASYQEAHRLATAPTPGPCL